MEGSVVVCNVFPDDNKGGCAITQQTIEWLKGVFPGCPVFIVPVEQKGTYEESGYRFTLGRHPDTGILRSPIGTDGSFVTTCAGLFRSLGMLWGRPGESPFERTIADAKVVVSKGGYVFVERDTIGGLLALWFTAFPLIYAARRNVPTVALCTTVGPYRRFLSRALCRWILKRIDTVVTRDPISTAEAARLGCRDVRECPDIVMTFDESRIDFRYPQEQLRSAGVYGVVVISSETRKLDEVFLERLGALTERILRDGLVDRLVLTVQSMEDARITSRFLRSQNDPRYILVEDDLSPEESMGIYKGARFLIGRRLHAGLFALLGGTPIVLFSTDGVKTDGVMRELGLSNRVDRYPDFSVDEVHRLLVTMTQREEEEKEIVGKRVEEARRRAVAKLSALGRQLQAEKRSTGTAGELIL